MCERIYRCVYSACIYGSPLPSFFDCPLDPQKVLFYSSGPALERTPPPPHLDPDLHGRVDNAQVLLKYLTL